MVHRKSVRFSGRDSVSDCSSPASCYKAPPTPTRSILRGRNSVDSQLSEDSVITSETNTESSVTIVDTEEIQLLDYNLPTHQSNTVKEVPLVLEPIKSQETKTSNSNEVKTAKLEHYRTWHSDQQRGQIYSVGSFRAGQESSSDLEQSDAAQTKRYVLNPDHAAHRDKQNREKFNLITARFNVELDRAKSSLAEKQEAATSGPTIANLEHIQEYQLNRHIDRVLGANQGGETPQKTENSERDLSTFNADNYTAQVRLNQRQLDLAPKPVFSTTASATEAVSRDIKPPSFSTSTITTNPTLNTTTNQTTNMSQSIYASPRLAEKQELIALNSRLHQYVRHMREMKEDAGYLDSKVFLESVGVLEEELLKLKALYEQELDQARIKIDDINRAKKHFEMEEKKAKALACELKNRLEIEAERNNRNSVEINSLQRALAQKDLMIEEGRIAMITPTQDLQKLNITYQTTLRDYEEVKKRLEKEQLARQDAEDRFDTLHKKFDFTAQIAEQEKRDMQDRLNAANNTILALEEKVREMSHHDKTLVDMLKRVRESAETELQKYQDESEERHNRHLTELKAQIDEDDKRISELTDETVRLNEQITNLLGTNRQLEGQCQSLDHQKVCYMKMLEDERKRATNHVKKMEFKLREMQEVLISKMRELNAARESQIPLKAEIEGFRSLIEEEERRIRLGPGEFPELPVLPQSYRRETHAAPTAPTLVPQPLGAGSKPVLPSAHGYMEGNPQPRPLGPVRIRSAPPPATLRQRNLNLVPHNIGQGKDYFEEMFRDLKIPESVKESPRSLRSKSPSPQTLQPARFSPVPPRTSPQNQHNADILSIHDDENVYNSTDAGPSHMGLMPKPPPMSRSQTMGEENEETAPSYQNTHLRESGYEPAPNSCATGDMKILEVHPEGRYIRIVNTGQTRDEEIGGYLIQQNVGGFPVAVFRFPPRTRLLSNEVATVWSGTQDNSRHQPPSDFVFKEQQKWGTGSECTTIVCKPNGQAVAWQSGTVGGSRSPFNEGSVHNPSMAYQEDPNSNANNNNFDDMASAEEQLSEFNMNVNGAPPEPQFLRREKQSPPCLAQPKHPHGLQPQAVSHPSTGQQRTMTYGNDNSSVNRQSRAQGARPDPIPGAPYAGASAQRMGSASLRAYKSGTSGAIANKADAGTETSQPPNSFQKPHNRFQTGLEQIQSQHHMDFNPPMPRPPLFSSW